MTSVLMCVGPEEQQSGYNQASKGRVCNETLIKADIQIETPKQELTSQQLHSSTCTYLDQVLIVSVLD